MSFERGALLRTWAGVVLISFSGILVRLANTEPDRAAFWRAGYALPVLVVIAIALRRRRRLGLTGAFLPLAAIAGGFLGADLLVWHRSIGIIGAGLATVLPNLQVVVVGVLGIVLFRERPRGSFWLALPIVLAGVWLLAVTGHPLHAGGPELRGVLLGVLTAGFYSVYLLLLRMARLKRPTVGAPETMAAATFGAAVVAGVAAGAGGVLAPPPTLVSNGWLVLLALGAQVFGWLLLSSSIHRLPAALTSVALLLQPALAMVWGFALLGEPIGLVQVGGAAVLLAGVLLAHRAVVRGSRPAPAS